MLTFRCLLTATLLLAGVGQLSSLALGAQLRVSPVVGATEMREARVWVQTTAPAEVRLAYWPKEDASARTLSEPVRTDPAHANTAIVKTGVLKPGQAYGYEVVVDGKPVKGDFDTRFTTAPMFRGYTPPPDFVVALGGGHYVNDEAYDPLNRTPGGDYDVFLSIYAQSPNLMLWLGNNVYLREADYTSRAGIFDRYGKSRQVEEIAPLLANVPQAAVWGAADYGFAVAGKDFRNRADAREAFERFWPNPPAAGRTLATHFSYGDAEFFLLDVNSARDTMQAQVSRRAYLGAEQIEWLIKQLQLSRANFKIIVTGGAIINPATEETEQATIAPAERDALMRKLQEARVNGVVFVSGGKNYGELTKLVRAGGPPLYELSVGPLTHRADSNSPSLNYFREPSTVTFVRQFGLLRFGGAENARSLILEVRNTQGDLLWSRTITQSEVSYQ